MSQVNKCGVCGATRLQSRPGMVLGQGDYCYGCRHYICDRHDAQGGPMGPHEVKDHVEEEDYSV